MSDGITDGYRMSERSPKDIGRGLDPVPTHFEMGEKGITGERGITGCMGEVGSPLSENNVDEIEVQNSEKVYAIDEPDHISHKAMTYFDWWKKNEELNGDSFLDVGEDYLEWGELDAITYLTRKIKWHKEITDPLATFLLENYSTRITHEVHSMYDLAIQIMREQLPTPSEKFTEWDKVYRDGSFMTLSQESLATLTKDELVVYIMAEREEHRNLNRPLYEYVMENHNDSVMQYGSIQAAILDLLRSK